MAELVVGGLTALVCGPVVFAAAAQDDDGSIWGVVTDELGGLLPGVTVTVRSPATGIARSGVTGGVGSYEVTRLPAGDYEVTAALPGFRGAAVTATVAGAETIVDFVLSIAPLAETVTVTRSGQGLDDVANAVTVLGSEALGFTERKASLDEALRGVPGLTVQNRRDYGLTGGVALSVRAPPSEPNLGIRGLAVIQDGIPLTTTDGTTEPGSVDLGAVRRIAPSGARPSPSRTGANRRCRGRAGRPSSTASGVRRCCAPPSGPPAGASTPASASAPST